MRVRVRAKAKARLQVRGRVSPTILLTTASSCATLAARTAAVVVNPASTIAPSYRVNFSVRRISCRDADSVEGGDLEVEGGDLEVEGGDLKKFDGGDL